MFYYFIEYALHYLNVFIEGYIRNETDTIDHALCFKKRNSVISLMCRCFLFSYTGLLLQKTCMLPICNAFRLTIDISYFYWVRKFSNYMNVIFILEKSSCISFLERKDALTLFVVKFFQQILATYIKF